MKVDECLTAPPSISTPEASWGDKELVKGPMVSGLTPALPQESVKGD